MIEIGNAIVTGLITALIVGPVFFSLIQTSIEKGVKSGALMAIGISLSDTLYISLAYFGISQLSENMKFKLLFAITGGLVMLVFGIRMFSRPVYHPGTTIHLSESENIFWKIFKGFILNGINPFVFLYWIGIVSLVSVHWEYRNGSALLFFISLLLTIFLTDIGKAYLANRIRTFITPHLMKVINKIVGIAFIILGARLLIFAMHLGEQIRASGHPLLLIIPRFLMATGF